MKQVERGTSTGDPGASNSDDNKQATALDNSQRQGRSADNRLTQQVLMPEEELIAKHTVIAQGKIRIDEGVRNNAKEKRRRRSQAWGTQLLGEADNEKDWLRERFAQVVASDGSESDSDSEETWGIDDEEPDQAIIRARQRNDLRIRLANERDASIVGKYLPSDVTVFFPSGLRMVGPDDFRRPSESWVEKVRTVANSDCPTPTKPGFHFDISEESLSKNGWLLEKAGWDMEALIQSQRGSTVWHGSEFRPIYQLKTVIGQHPSFGYIEKIVSEGMDYECTRNLSEEERRVELRAQIERGNHKSASENTDEIQKLLLKDVTHGFSLPIKADIIGRLQGAMVQPCGMVSQFSLQADGSRKKKNRLTHDLSFSLAVPDGSVNDRIDMSVYPELVYGWCLIRVVHFIVCLRAKHPDAIIYIMKFDYSDAYRRISYAARAAIQSVLILMGVAYIALRLAFGGSPNPACWCAFSETMTDMANELSCSDFDPDEVSSPTVRQDHLIPREYKDETTSFARAIPPAFEVPTTLDSRKDCFIDDIVCVFLSTKKNLKREGHTVPLAVHTLSRPHQGDGNEPIKRRPLLGREKLEAEGRPSETMVVLGWEVDTRRLVVSLPNDKFIAWSGDLREVISAGCATSESLESLIGRLNHASFLVPLSRHFLNDVRKKIKPGRWMKKRTVRLSHSEIEDLKLWEQFLITANRGISMNLLTIRQPSSIGWSDSCPFGLGGYTLRGRAWRLKIPPSSPLYGDDTVNNALEFLGMAVTTLLLLEEMKEQPFPCLLALGDNTSAIGWIFKSGKVTRESKYYEAVKFISRQLASKVMGADAQIMSQHFKGSKNIVADLLSFAGEARGKANSLTRDEPPDNVLTKRVLTHYSQLVPEGFRILPLPDEILSFAFAAIQMLEGSWTQNRKSRLKRRTGPGEDGRISHEVWEFSTPSSLTYQTQSEKSWPDVSLSIIETQNSISRGDLLADVRNRWWNRLSGMPLAIWQRRFGQTTGPVPSTSRVGQHVCKHFGNQ